MRSESSPMALRGWPTVWLILAAVSTSEAWGAEWSTDPWADMRAEYNDNILLIPSVRDQVTGGVARAGLRVQRSDELGFFRVSPTLRATRYDSAEPLDSNDQFVDATWVRRGELGRWRVDANWSRDTTLTSELEITGLVQTRKRRMAYYVAPSYTYALSPRNTLGWNLAYSSAEYENALFTGLVDYTFINGGLSWGYSWSEQTVISVAALASRMEAEKINNTLDSTGVQIQMDTNITERWGATLSGGFRHSESNRRGAGGSSDGWLANASMNRKDEYGLWRVGLSRTVDPSGIGTLVQRDQLSLARDQALSPYWHLNARVHLASVEDVQRLGVRINRDYRSGSLKLSRVITPGWAIEMIYSYDWQQYARQTTEAERNIVMVGLRYDPKPVRE